MLGRDMVRAATESGHEAIALAHDDLDVTDAAAARARLRGERPDVVVNCAAHTDVDGAEREPEAALALNSPEGLFRAAAETGAVLVQPSTDYVFDGSKRSPYVESDTPAPRSAYGRSKLAGERALARVGPNHLVVRTAWLYGTGGGNFVATMLRLGAERDEVRVVDDQVGSPTYTPHLAGGILALIEARARGVHHLAAAGECSWFAFAQAIFARARVACEVLPTSSEEFARPAPRPAYSVLRSERPGARALPHWSEGLSSYLGAGKLVTP